MQRLCRQKPKETEEEDEIEDDCRSWKLSGHLVHSAAGAASCNEPWPFGGQLIRYSICSIFHHQKAIAVSYRIICLARP